MAELKLAIEGMSCDHCVGRVKKALAKVPGIQVKHVDVGRAVVDAADPAAVEQSVIEAMDDAGYPAHVER